MKTTFHSDRSVILLEDSWGRSVEVVVIRKRRSTYSLRVLFGGRAEMMVPLEMTEEAARTVVEANAEALFRQMEKASRRAMKAMPKTFTSGDTLSFLGEEYTLRVQAGLPLWVERKEAEKEVWVTLPPPVESPERVRNLLLQWYRIEARKTFPKRVKEGLERAEKLGFPPLTKLDIRETRSRWGSCSSQGRMMLSSLLVQAPVECVDYVILHELCHLRELNHSSRFYALLTQLLPNWKALEESLKSYSCEW